MRGTERKTARTDGFLQISDNDVLICEGEKMIQSDSLRSRGEECMREVVERYREKTGDAGLRKDAVKALRHLGNLHMTYLIDYRKAFMELTEARHIAEKDRDSYELAYIMMSLSNLYYFGSNGDERLRNQGIGYQKEAYRLSVESHNENILASSVLNMATLAFNDSAFKVYVPIWKDIVSHDFYNAGGEALMARRVAEAMLAYTEGNAAECEKNLSETVDELEKMQNITYKERFYFTLKRCLYKLQMFTGNLDRAASTAYTCLDKAQSNGNLDYELNTYGMLAEIYKRMNMPDSLNKYQSLYLADREKMGRQNGYASLKLYELENSINEEKDRSAVNKARRLRITLLTAFLALAISGITVWLLMLRRRRRVNKSVTLKIPSSRDNRGTSERVIEEEGQKVIPEEESARLKDIYERILALMVNSDEICQTGYSLRHLAKSLSEPVTAVSRAINRYHHTNFPQMLAEYRVSKVKELMRQPDSKNLTIQYFSEKVGFKSRTHFIATFKKLTGETPSQYWNRTEGIIGKK